MRRNKSKQRFLSVAVALAMTATMVGNVPAETKKAKAAEEVTLSNLRVEYNTRDTIEFGHYLQEDTNGDGEVDEKDEKQPIKWQILSKNGDELFLLADKGLDCKKYNEENTDVTWETCTLRKWLNDDFLNTAFSADEQKGITTTTVVNADNSEYDTAGGNDTEDKIYLLSLDEVANTSYGFRSDGYYGDQARICEATSYAKKIDTSSWWWLRSPGFYSNCAASVTDKGDAYTAGASVDYSYYVVRPALHMNLSSLSSSDYKICEKENVSIKASTYDLIELGRYGEKVLQWRVLSKEGNDVFLLADRYIDEKKYNEELDYVTWETCTLRKWLNEDFYDSAFSENEKTAIKKLQYENADNPIYGTKGGNDTEDKVTLLSLSDVVNPSYGFPTKYCDSETRVATSLDSNSMSYSDSWWLRSPGVSDNVAYVDSGGCARAIGYYVSASMFVVRPALHLDLFSLSSVKLVGTVVAGEDGIQYYDTEGKQTDGTVPTAEPTTTPEATATTTPTAAPTNTPEATVTVAPTSTPEATATTTPTAKPTTTPEVTATVEPTTTPEVTATVAPTSTPEVTATVAPTKVPNVGSSASPTVTSAPVTDTKPVTKPSAVKGFKAKAAKGKLQLSWKKVVGATGYEIQYSMKSNFKSGGKVTITNAATKTKTIKGLKKEKKYYVRIRAYKKAGSKKAYSAWKKISKKTK